ncbi:jg13696 [Pararge aegeria aegeria]|uniref:Jg13696 protein n=1 Tax=Pararge aegeria aegeria TaxID=348720 RepID=A0A8S4RND6_9NEOP|nr:jg13696 [Pararge aegeria aegeria]
MYKLYVIFLSIVSVYVDGASLKNDLFRLDIVHYNDFHARFEETTISYPVCTSNDTSCLGGYARLYYEIKTLLKEKPGALLLNAGDTFQGTYWYTLLKWNITQKFINMLPNDAHTIGNHEFDDGVAGVAPYLAALQAPVVVANIDTRLEPSLNGLYKPHIVLKRRGRNIGIIGLITTETKSSSNPEKVKFLDPIATVQREAQILTDEGVDIIIVLSHCGLEVDKKIASSVGENIDLIIGGHSHSLLWNGNSPSKEFVAGPYPVLVKTEANPQHEVLIVTAACFTKYLGNLTVYFDQKGNLKDFSGEPVFLNRSIPEGMPLHNLSS